MSVFTLEGQESASDLGEEGIGVRMGVPRAILGSVILSGIFGMITLVCVALAIPNLNATAASPTPIAYITDYWLGGAVGKVFLVFIIYSVFALIVVSIAAMARLLFSLGRDNMLPASRAISKVNEKTQTPINAIVITTTLFIVVMLIAAIFPSTYAILIASTPILAYLGYLTITVSYAIRRRHVAHIPTAFDLGKWAVPVFTVVLDLSSRGARHPDAPARLLCGGQDRGNRHRCRGHLLLRLAAAEDSARRGWPQSPRQSR